MVEEQATKTVRITATAQQKLNRMARRHSLSAAQFVSIAINRLYEEFEKQETK